MYESIHYLLNARFNVYFIIASNQFLSTSGTNGLKPSEPSAPRTDQPPARGGRLVYLSRRTVIIGTPLRNKDIPTKSPYPFQNPSKHVKAHTFSKKVSGPPGSNTSLQYITVTKSSVSERLMMLCVYPGNICTA